MQPIIRQPIVDYETAMHEFAYGLIIRGKLAALREFITKGYIAQPSLSKGNNRLLIAAITKKIPKNIKLEIIKLLLDQSGIIELLKVNQAPLRLAKQHKLHEISELFEMHGIRLNSSKTIIHSFNTNNKIEVKPHTAPTKKLRAG